MFETKLVKDDNDRPLNNDRAMRIRKVLKMPPINDVDTSTPEGRISARQTPAFDLDRPTSWRDSYGKEVTHIPEGFDEASPVQLALFEPETVEEHHTSNARLRATRMHTPTGLGPRGDTGGATDVRVALARSQAPTEVIHTLGGQFQKLDAVESRSSSGLYHPSSDTVKVGAAATDPDTRKSDTRYTGVILHELGHRADYLSGRPLDSTKTVGGLDWDAKRPDATPVTEGVAQGIARRYNPGDTSSYDNPEYWTLRRHSGLNGTLMNAAYELTREHVEKTGEIPTEDSSDVTEYLHKLISTSPHARNHLESNPELFEAIKPYLNTYRASNTFGAQEPIPGIPVISTKRTDLSREVKDYASPVTSYDRGIIYGHDFPVSHYPHIFNNNQFGED